MCEKLSFSVISDIHLTHFMDGAEFFEKTMKFHTEKLPESDAYVFLGDVIYQLDSPEEAICKNLYESHYDFINSCTERYIPGIPKIMVLGNHEFAQGNFDPEFDEKALKLWIKKFGQQPIEHTVINGYHFVKGPVLSWANTSSEESEEQMMKLLDEALLDGDKPVFLLTHCSVPKTVVLSEKEETHTDRFRTYLTQHPRIIHISGHLHPHVLDERAVYQEGCTFIGAPCNAVGAVIIDVPDYGEQVVTGFSHSLYFEVSGRRVTVHRIDDLGGREAGSPWVIDINEAEQGICRYDSARKDREPHPEFAEDASLRAEISGDTADFFVKQRFANDVMVQYYELRITDNSGVQVFSKRYYSDFFNLSLGKSYANEWKLTAKGLPSGKYTAEVYPQNSLLAFGKRPVSCKFNI